MRLYNAIIYVVSLFVFGCSEPKVPKSEGQIARPYSMPGVHPTVSPFQDTVQFLVAGLQEYETRPIQKFFTRNPMYWLLLQQAQDTTVQVAMLVGKSAAEELALAIEQMPTSYPLPGELLYNTIKELDYRTNSVVIDGLENGAFTASIYVKGPGQQTKRIRSRPAEAVVQALRSGCRLYILREVVIKNE